MGIRGRDQGIKSSGTRGAVSELIAAAHLMGQGWYVYRCESPNAPFDLVAYRDGQMLRVEVKTMTEPGNPTPTFTAPSNDEWDLLALVGSRGVLTFEHASIPEIRAAVRVAYGLAPVPTPRYVSCEQCGAGFTTSQLNARFCSAGCRARSYKSRYVRRPSRLEPNHG